MPPYLTLANKQTQINDSKGEGFGKGHVVHGYSQFSGGFIKGWVQPLRAHEL